MFWRRMYSTVTRPIGLTSDPTTSVAGPSYRPQSPDNDPTTAVPRPVIEEDSSITNLHDPGSIGEVLHRRGPDADPVFGGTFPPSCNHQVCESSTCESHGTFDAVSWFMRQDDSG